MDNLGDIIPAARLYEGAKFIEPAKYPVPVDTLLGRTLYLCAQMGESYTIPKGFYTLEYCKGRNQEQLDHKGV